MSHLSILKEKWPRADLMLQGVEQAPDSDESFDPGDAELICQYGISLNFYKKARLWLEKNEERRLFWIENRRERLARLLQGETALQILHDRQVQIFYVETPLEQQLAIEKICLLSAFKKLNILDPHWKSIIQPQAIAANLIASDAQDFGTTALRHAQANLRLPVKRLSQLKSSMKDVPAIVIGAGPSLEKNGHLLSSWQDKALLIAAGHAIHSIPTRPSLGVFLDPFEPIQKTAYSDVPFCLQGRVHPKTRKCTSGDILYFPDAHFAFEAWLSEEENLFNAGWTVGNAAAAVALELGCNPIIFVGMDYCYKGEQKYAWKKDRADMALVQALDANGKTVWTQNDWLLSIHWMEELARSHPDVDFINATEQGMRMNSPIVTKPLPIAPQMQGVKEKWQTVLQKTPQVKLSSDRLKLWAASLAECRWNLEREETGCHENLASKLLLDPLWNVWGSMFERELMTDSYPIALAEKLQIQKRLFFNRVIEEHLACLKS